MELLEKLTLKSTYDEIERVQELLDVLQDKLGFDDKFYANLMLTVSEAATNGIVHGNQLNASKSVYISAFRTDHDLIIEVLDEGDGFDPENLPNPVAEENLLNTGGRGVFLMKQYADDVYFNKSGQKISLVFHLPEA